MSKDKPTSTRAATSHIAPFGLRMQPELRAQLEEAAAANGRSMNSEIIARLEVSFGEKLEMTLTPMRPGAIVQEFKAVITTVEELQREIAELKNQVGKK